MIAQAKPRQLPFFVGRYRCEEYLGGGMAEVYRARDTELPRDVAIKILKQGSEYDEDARANFLDEVQLASRCSHENIVSTYDKGEFEGSPFIVMEFLRGQTLDAQIKSDLGGLKRVLQTALQIARAMEYVHGQNIVHRDLKPQNIHVDPSGRVKLVDFGIAKSVDWSKTQAGFTKGTAYYMAPEQVLAEPVSFQTDMWAFGVVLYEMLTRGRRPFAGTNIDTIWAAIINTSPDYQALAEAAAPEPVQMIVRRCLEKNPKRRYLSWDPICREIESVLEGSAAPTRVSIAILPPIFRSLRWKRPAVISTIVLAIVCAGLLLRQVSSKPPPPSPPPALAAELKLPTGNMVLVNAGPALLGSNKHKTDLKAFYIDKTEVSNRAYAEFLRKTGWRRPKDFQEQKPDYPVVNVTLYDAQVFAKWAGKRLPSDDEWEKSARGSNGQTYPWGNKEDKRLANLADNPVLTQHAITPVNSFPAGKSPFGALNMCGNVGEWVDAYQKPEIPLLKQFRQSLDRTLTQEEAFYVVRGGFFGMPLSPRLVYDDGPFPARLV